MPAESTRKPRTRLSREARKTSFLDAAARLIRDKGLEGLSMEGLAAFCGVNKALPYQHFANRDDLLVALYERNNQVFDATLDHAGPAEGFEANLRAMVYTWYEDVQLGKGTPELLQARTLSGELESRRRVRMARIVEYIADVIQQSYDIQRDRAKLAASVLLAGSQGLSSTWQTPDTDHTALIESFITMSLGAVAAIADSGCID